MGLLTVIASELRERSAMRWLQGCAILFAFAFVLFAVPARFEGPVLVPISPGHGLALIDVVALVPLLGGLALLVGGLWQRRERLDAALTRRPWAARMGAFGVGLGLGLLIASVAILAVFVVWELRYSAPLVPFGVFRIRTLTGANIVGLLMGAALYANFFILTLYVQQVLGWSALKTGVTFLATAATTVIWAGVAQALVTRIGPRAVMTTGLAVLAAAMLGYTRLPVHGHYWPDLLPIYLIVALAIAFAFVPVTIAGFIGVPAHQAGLVSGLLNTTQQIGGAIGVAVTSTIFVSRAKTGQFTPQAYTSGYHWAFAALVAIAAVGAVAAFVYFRGARVPESESEPVTVSA